MLTFYLLSSHKNFVKHEQALWVGTRERRAPPVSCEIPKIPCIFLQHLHWYVVCVSSSRTSSSARSWWRFSAPVLCSNHVMLSFTLCFCSELYTSVVTLLLLIASALGHLCTASDHPLLRIFRSSVALVNVLMRGGQSSHCAFQSFPSVCPARVDPHGAQSSQITQGEAWSVWAAPQHRQFSAFGSDMVVK